jgi:hypothetical protein
VVRGAQLKEVGPTIRCLIKSSPFNENIPRQTQAGNIKKTQMIDPTNERNGRTERQNEQTKCRSFWTRRNGLPSDQSRPSVCPSVPPLSVSLSLSFVRSSVDAGPSLLVDLCYGVLCCVVVVLRRCCSSCCRRCVVAGQPAQDTTTNNNTITN